MRYSAYVCGNSFKIIKMITIDNVQYLTIQEYADKFGITIQTVYNRIRDKKLETKKLMGLTLVRL
jgi:DNA invertase Pin-like site-specific DNA recombinase